MEIAVEPVGGDDPHIHELVARCVQVIGESGLSYRVGPMSTTVQGRADELFELARRMHFVARGANLAPRVITTMRIDDTTGTEHSLEDRVKLVEGPELAS